MSATEENPFEEKHIAEEWIAAVESEVGGARENEVYPRLQSWIFKNHWTSVLEVGAGQGICSKHVGDIDYVGIEPSTFLIKRAQELYGNDKRKFIQGSAYNLDFDNTCFDAAFSVGTWFHLENLNKAHKELNRVLKQNGGIFIVTSNPEVSHVWESIVVGKKDGKKIVGETILPTGKLSRNILYLHSEEEIVSSLREYSFEILDIQKFGSGSKNVEIGIEKVWMAIEAVKRG